VLKSWVLVSAYRQVVMLANQKLCVVLIVIVCALPLTASSENGEAEGRRLSILILAPPFSGHLSPPTALGEELVRRGHNVTLFTLTVQWSDTLRKTVERAGINFLGAAAGEQVSSLMKMAGKSHAEQQQLISSPISMAMKFKQVFQEMSQTVVQIVDTDAIVEWDVIIATEFLAPLLACLHWKWKIPSVVLSAAMQFQPHTLPQWPFPSLLGNAVSDNLSFKDRLVSGILSVLFPIVYEHVLVRVVKDSIEDTCAGASLTYISTAPGVNIPQIVQTVIGFEFPRTISPLSEYVGPILSKSPVPLSEELEIWLKDKPEKSVIYISMGSVFSMSNETGLAIVNGINATKYTVLWSLRNQDILEGMELDPQRFFISSWTPQLSILQHKAIGMAIMHGGMNGINEALYNGVPIIALPFLGDQVFSAGVLQHRGLGIKLDQRKLTPERIEESINHIESGNYHKQASSIRKMFLQAGGVERAADLVEFYEEVGYDHLVPAYAKYEWSWVQYYNVDVYSLLLCTALLCMYCTVRLCSCVRRRCAGTKVKKE